MVSNNVFRPIFSDLEEAAPTPIPLVRARQPERTTLKPHPSAAPPVRRQQLPVQQPPDRQSAEPQQTHRQLVTGRLKASAEAGTPPHSLLNKALQKQWVTDLTELYDTGDRKCACTLSTRIIANGQEVTASGKGRSKAIAKRVAVERLVGELIRAGV